jgi:hypothetical protein
LDHPHSAETKTLGRKLGDQFSDQEYVKVVGGCESARLPSSLPRDLEARISDSRPSSELALSKLSIAASLTQNF